jgi:hypothetical protein
MTSSVITMIDAFSDTLVPPDFLLGRHNKFRAEAAEQKKASSTREKASWARPAPLCGLACA